VYSQAKSVIKAALIGLGPVGDPLHDLAYPTACGDVPFPNRLIRRCFHPSTR
jgi:hypothetical protein